MSDEPKDVVIAAYLFEDLAKNDFDAVLKLAEDKPIAVEGVAWSRRTRTARRRSTETGDHLGRKGAISAAAWPRRRPLRTAAAGRDRGRSGRSRGLTGKFANTGSKRIGKKMDEALPPSSGGLIAVATRSGADIVDKASSTPSRNPWRSRRHER